MFHILKRETGKYIKSMYVLVKNRKCFVIFQLTISLSLPLGALSHTLPDTCHLDPLTYEHKSRFY